MLTTSVFTLLSTPPASDRGTRSEMQSLPRRNWRTKARMIWESWSLMKRIPRSLRSTRPDLMDAMTSQSTCTLYLAVHHTDPQSQQHPSPLCQWAIHHLLHSAPQCHERCHGSYRSARCHEESPLDWTSQETCPSSPTPIHSPRSTYQEDKGRA